jgi:hypothetical protein
MPSRSRPSRRAEEPCHTGLRGSLPLPVPDLLQQPGHDDEERRSHLFERREDMSWVILVDDRHPDGQGHELQPAREDVREWQGDDGELSVPEDLPVLMPDVEALPDEVAVRDAYALVLAETPDVNMIVARSSSVATSAARRPHPGATVAPRSAR